MTTPNRDDISIGEDEWITFIDVAGRQEHAVYIDHLIARAGSFWKALETDCVATCCGIDAFSMWPEDIRRVSGTVDRQSLAEALAALRQFVEHSAADVFVSQRLNNYFDRRVLLQLIDHIYEHALSPPVPEP